MQFTFALDVPQLRNSSYESRLITLGDTSPPHKPKHVILIGCLCSIATEATQYLLKMGWCETDDVIHNTLGTAIGVWIWHLQSKRLNKPKSNELPKE